MNLLFSLGFLVGFSIKVRASDDEFRLIRDLRRDYDKGERPVANHSDAIRVKLRVILQQIVDVKWHDYKMRWDPSEYGNITTLHLDAGFLWRPDILLFNSADDQFDPAFAVNFIVQHTGEVMQIPPGILQASCTIDITWFPYDEQLCYLKYGSWTHGGREVDIAIDTEGLDGDHMMDLQYFVNNGEWDLLATPAQRVATDFNGQKFVEIYFHLHLSRKTLYYELNWIVPSLLISVINVLGYALPTAGGEKICLQTMNFLAIFVFLGMVNNITPATSESIPIIALYLSFSIVLLAASVILNMFIINVFHRSPETHEMGPWVRSLLMEWLPSLLLMKRPGKELATPSTKNTESNRVTIETIRNAARIARHQISSGIDYPYDQADHSSVAYSTSATAIRECCRVLEYFKSKMDEDKVRKAAKDEWRNAAMVLDRLCLYTFTALLFGTLFLLKAATRRSADYSSIPLKSVKE